LSIIPLKNELTIRILTDKKEILKYLHLGISMPIWPELHKYIMRDLEFYRARSMLLLEDGNPVGNALIFNDKSDVLYFGYFGVINHEKGKIIALIHEIVKYAFFQDRSRSNKHSRSHLRLGFLEEGRVK